MHKLVTVANPAAGQNWSQVVPAGKAWIVRCGTFLFTTSATVANRLVQIAAYATDGTSPIFISDQGPAQAASLANQRYSFAQDLVSVGALPSKILTFPRLVLLTGCKISTSIVALDATDTLTAINLWVDEMDSEEMLRYGTFYKLF